MSAGLEGFLTGFFGARAEGMQRDQAKADAYEERMRNIAQRNSIIAQNRTSMADAAKSMGDKLLAWGATPEQIQAALGSGQTGLQDLYKTVSTVHNTLGPEEAKRFLGSENVGADLGMAKAVGEEGLANLYKSTFGLPMGMKTGDYKAPEESTLAKLFGYTDRKAKMMQELDAELSGTGGYSVYDLTTIGSLPDYIPGSSGENITYKTPSIYTKANYSDAIDDVRKDITMVRQSSTFENAEKSIAELEKDILEQKKSSAYDQATVERLEELKAEKVKQRDSLLDSALKETILTKSSMYFNSDTYLEDMQSFVESNLGYTPSWMGELVESEKAVNEVVNKSLGGSLTAQPESQTAAALNDSKPTVVNTITTESGKTYDVVEQGGVKLVRDPASGKTMNEALSKEFIDAAVEVDAIKYVKPTYTSKVGEMPINGDVITDPTVVSQSGEPITWDGVVTFAGDVWKKVSENVAGTFEDKGVSIAGYTEGDIKKEVKTILEEEGITEEMIKDAANRAPEHLDTIMKQVESAITNYTEMKASEPENRMISTVEEFTKDMPDFITPMGNVAKEAWGKLSQYYEGSKVQQVFENISKAGPKDSEVMVQQVLDHVNKLEESGVEPLYNPRAVGTVGFRDFGLREDIRDVVEALDTKEADRKESERQTIEAYDRQFIRDWEGMPVRDKAIIRDVLYGKKKEEFTEEENARLNEMRKSNPEWFIDTPPELLGAGMPASEYDTTFKSRTDRPTGMMSPMPATDAELEGTPTIGTDTELDNMLVRVHGKKGDAMQSFLSKVRTGKAKTADVTRIINSTKKLPKTGTRDKVLEKLYALRDSMK